MSILYRPGAVGGKSVTSLSLCALAVAVVIAFAGCGGGSSDSSGGEGQASGAGGETTAASGEGSGKGAEGKGESSSGGSESSPGKAPSGAISDSEFVKQANAICEEGKKQFVKELSTYVKEHKGDSGQGNLGALKGAIQAVIVPAIQVQAEEIRALSVSGDAEAQVDAFATALEDGVENAEQAQGSSPPSLGKDFKHSAELAREYGLEGCVYG